VDTLFNVVQHWFTLSPDGGTFRSAQYRLWSLPKLFDNADTKTQPAKSTDVMFCELEGDTFLALRLPHPTGVGHVDEWRFPNGRASPRGPEPLWYLIFKREKQQSFRVQDVTKVEIQSNPFTLQGAHAAFTLSVQAGDREVFSLPTLQPKLGLWPSEKEMQLAKIFSKLERFGHALFFLKEQGADQKQSDPN